MHLRMAPGANWGCCGKELVLGVALPLSNCIAGGGGVGVSNASISTRFFHTAKSTSAEMAAIATVRTAIALFVCVCGNAFGGFHGRTEVLFELVHLRLRLLGLRGLELCSGDGGYGQVRAAGA